MHAHFSKVAPTYNEIRTTDPEPILYIKERLIDRDLIQAIDIGCGSGRYDLLLCNTISGIELICSDVNESMIMETNRYLKSHGVENFSTLHGDISMLELEYESMDCVLTFNAIHHFEPVTFLCKAANALREGGYVFIYTRLRSQNAKNIWGRFFPEFSKTETRLYDLHQVEQWMTSTDMRLSTIEFFRFKRIASLAHLVHQATNRHYSTFSLYSSDAFERALQGFQENIKSHFPDPNHIEWYDENVMIVFQKVLDPT